METKERVNRADMEETTLKPQTAEKEPDIIGATDILGRVTKKLALIQSMFGAGNASMIFDDDISGDGLASIVGDIINEIDTAENKLRLRKQAA